MTRLSRLPLAAFLLPLTLGGCSAALAAPVSLGAPTGVASSISADPFAFFVVALGIAAWLSSWLRQRSRR